MSETPVLSVESLKSGGRDESGRFLPGNMAAFKDGRRAAVEQRDDLAPLHQERVDNITRDLGGPSELSHMEQTHVREISRLELIVEALGTDLLTRGMLTSKGRQRATLGAYLTSLDRLTRLSATIGLQRRQKTATSLQAAILAEVAHE